jgi:hypothetical protein
VRPLPCDPDESRTFAILGLSTARKQELARAYLAKMDPAIEGQGGDSQTFTAACCLVVDFALSPEEARPLLREYNRRCVPPWEEGQLVHKLEKALEKAQEKPEDRGRRLRAVTGPAGRLALTPGEPATAAVAAGPFLGTVPNFVLADWRRVCPRPRWRKENGERQRGRRWAFFGLWWLIHGEVIRQKRARVCLPDVLLAQVVWGDRRNWPRNWRQRVGGWLLRIVRSCSGEQAATDKPLIPTSRACPPDCPLHGRAGVRHIHFLVTVPQLYRYVSTDSITEDFDRSFLGVLDLFGFKEGGERRFDFSLAGEDQPEATSARLEQIEAYRKPGRLCSVYLPVLVFGLSPRSGLTFVQRKILIALTRETTRAKQSCRADRARVVVGGEPDDKATRFAVCPFLERGERYVSFNGNGGYMRSHLRGRGYQLLGKTGKGWLGRAGFEVPEDEEGKWRAVRRFLTHLLKLSGPFGLIVGGWHPEKRRWRSLGEMIELTKTPAGRSWLARCRVRIYTKEDYLLRWRRYFAERLGFTVIPGDGDEGGTTGEAQTGKVTVESAEDLDLWMRRVGLTDQQLADMVKKSRSYVSRQRSGRAPSSKKFQAQVTAEVARYEAAQPREERA